MSCHTPGGLAPLDLGTFSTVKAAARSIESAVVSRRMPPFMAAPCCADYAGDRNLSVEEIELIKAFVAAGAPEGDPAAAPPHVTPPPLLSRVDVTLGVPAPYTPAPPVGSTDDNRCFALEWPLEEDGFITGLSPRPGNRALVHHLLVAALVGDAAIDARNLDQADPLPGFDCNGGLGRFKDPRPLGGSLLGGDLPNGIGAPVKAGSVLLLNVHYSVARTTLPGTDQTEIDFKFDRNATPSDAMAIFNPAWLVGTGMQVKAGDANAAFFYSAKPDLFTGGKRVLIQGVTPHMHHYGDKLTVRIIAADGTQRCLLEIPRWEFGWEQPYWLKTPMPLEPGERVYLECRFDNSEANQPPGRAPSDFAWGGNDQDMCTAFLSFTRP